MNVKWKSVGPLAVDLQGVRDMGEKPGGGLTPC